MLSLLILIQATLAEAGRNLRLDIGNTASAGAPRSAGSGPGKRTRIPGGGCARPRFVAAAGVTQRRSESRLGLGQQVHQRLRREYNSAIGLLLRLRRKGGGSKSGGSGRLSSSSWGRSAWFSRSRAEEMWFLVPELTCHKHQFPRQDRRPYTRLALQPHLLRTSISIPPLLSQRHLLLASLSPTPSD